MTRRLSIFCLTLIGALACDVNNTCAQEKERRIRLEIQVLEEGEKLPRKVVVKSLTPRGVGQRMGLVEGDIILAINEKRVDSVEVLQKLLVNDSAWIVWQDKDQKKYYGCMVSYSRTVHKVTLIIEELQTGGRFEDLPMPKRI